jgi:hypothetical protein
LRATSGSPCLIDGPFSSRAFDQVLQVGWNFHSLAHLVPPTTLLHCTWLIADDIPLFESRQASGNGNS